MLDLNINILGMKFKNFIFIVVGLGVKDGEFCFKVVKFGVGGIVIKIILVNFVDVLRLCMVKINLGFLNIEFWLELLKE